VGISPSDTNRSGVAAFLGGGVQTLTLTLNALAYSAAGSTIASRKNSDGNYYTVTFPDDFVHTTNSEDTLDVSDQTGVTVPRDPFVGLRSASAPYQIDTPLDITIEIPEGMSIGTNTHVTHVKARDVFSAWDNDHSGLDAIRNSSISYESHSVADRHHYREACADPCILIDFNTDKVTQQTIGSSTITIENSGNTLGGGGFGGMGGIQFKLKGNNGEGGGGGGAGMGLHQAIPSDSYPTNSTQYSYYQFSNIATTTISGGVIQIPETPGDFLPLPGSGGLGYHWWPHVATDIGVSNYAANGSSSDIDSSGAGGAGQLTTTIPGRTYPSLTATTEFFNREIDYSVPQGGWGGNVVYFRSNVFSDSALSGTHVNIINKSTGYMRGGCGGGGGGADGGAGGAGGSWYSGGSYNTAAAHGSPGAYHTTSFLEYSAGLEGSLLFWNTSNVAFSNTFTNERGDGNWMQGRDARVT
tara:strand:- start:13681 stop:15087 length:1407 start_codon:yes stop_codon:yes gene_type:complete